MRLRGILLAAACLCGSLCAGPALSPALAALPAANPFAAPSTLPYQAPRFDRIKDGDYRPALEEGMRQHLAEITAIANNKAAPSFENTIVAMERAGRLLDRVGNVFFAVVQANTNPALDKIQTEFAPRLAAHDDAIRLNPRLFARIKTLHDQQATLKRFRRKGDRVQLIPANPALRPIDVPAADVQIRGVVRGLVRHYARPAAARAR